MKTITALLITFTLTAGCVHRAPVNPLLKEYLKAVKASPSANSWNDLGLFYADTGDLAAGEKALRKALALDPKSATILNNLGAVLARQGDLEGALEQFQKTSSLVTSHNNLAVVLFEAGKYEQCHEELVKALAIQPDFGPALANLKLVQQRIEKRPEGQ